MLESLVARAEAIRARGKVLESVPGSGYHVNDRDHTGTKYLAPQRNGFNGPGENLVPFLGERDVIFAGSDAPKALAAIRAWAAKYEVLSPHQMTGTQQKMIYAIIPRLAVKDELLTIWLSDWNDVLEALTSQGVGLSGADLIPKD
jgi:hypothetical protein